MKPAIILILFLSFTLTSMAQDTLGFTNKAEAKNLMVNGKKEGKWFEYLDSTKYESDGNDGTEETGTIRTDDTNAPYYSLTIYRNDSENGTERIYYNGGKLKAEYHYKNGLVNGINRLYYENGKLEAEYPFENGLEVGLEKEYYKNGKLRTKTFYTNGIKGRTRNYDEYGNEIK